MPVNEIRGHQGVALVDCRAKEAHIERLQKEGYRVIATPPDVNLSSPVAAHPDLLFCKVSGRLVCREEYLAAHPDLAALVCEAVGEDNLIISHRVPSPIYPGDVGLCALPLGNLLFCRLDSALPELIRVAEDEGIQTVGVGQGYAACTCIALSPDRMITADEGIARVAESLGVTVLRISPGGVSLPPYKYGFIGGCCGVGVDTVYFFGDPLTHPDGRSICRFIEESGKRVVPLGEGELEDHGKILFI